MNYNNAKNWLVGVRQMADLFKLGMKLLKEIPNSELQEKFYGVSGVYSRLVFANRIDKGFTQQELADLARVDITTIYRIEGGYDGVAKMDLDNVFAVLEITPEDIKSGMVDREELLKEIERNKK